MLRIPENFVHTRSTPFWNKETAPKALFTHHNTKVKVVAVPAAAVATDSVLRKIKKRDNPALFTPQ